MRIAVVVGNPKPQSRTLSIAEALAAKIEPEADTTVLDLALFSDKMFAWPEDDLAEISVAVATNDLIIVASPTYKATYSGLLKAFLDRYPHRGLAGALAVPVMTVANDMHHLAPELGLRSLLVELGAVVPTSSLAFPMPQYAKMAEVIDTWAEQNSVALELLRLRGTRSRAHSKVES